MDWIIYISIAVNALFLTVVTINYLSPIWTFQHHEPDTDPSDNDVLKSHSCSVSLMIPVRNEYENLTQSIPSVLKVDYPNLNIIYFDDDSSDGSIDLLNDYASKHPQIRVITPKQSDIFSNSKLQGKLRVLEALTDYENKVVDSDIIIFTDADDLLDPAIIDVTVSRMKQSKLEILSFFPRQSFGSITERLFSPIADIILFTLLPLKLVEMTGFPSVAAANGQWIAIRKGVLANIGGWAALQGSLVEDTGLARLAKSKGHKVGVYSGIKYLSTRMYKNASEIYNGFSKNFYGISGGTSYSSILMGILYFIAGVGPIACLFFSNNYPLSSLPLLLLIFWRGMLSEKLGHGLVAVLLFPITSVLILLISVNSAIQVPKGNIIWKGRKL